MAEDDAPENTDEEGEGTEEEKVGGKKKFLIIGLVLLLLIGGGAGAYFGGLIGGGEETEEHSEDGSEEGSEEEVVAKPVYYELEEFLINLSTTGRAPSFIKMTVVLELKSPEAVATVEEGKPRIEHEINTYARELRPSDLSGSAGVYRLKKEIMERLDLLLEPGLVTDVLFTDFIVQ